MRQLAATLVFYVILTGCGKASAAAFDPQDDVHCSIMAFYFQGLAKHQNAPDDQQRATKALHDWYAAKMREQAAKRWDDMTEFEKEAGPLLEAVKADPAAFRDEMNTCHDRANAEPAFRKLARSYGFR